MKVTTCCLLIVLFHPYLLSHPEESATVLLDELFIQNVLVKFYLVWCHTRTNGWHIHSFIVVKAFIGSFEFESVLPSTDVTYDHLSEDKVINFVCVDKMQSDPVYLNLLELIKTISESNSKSSNLICN